MNITTIDFDIVMEPNIEAYNNIVPGVDWEALDEVEIFKFLFPNLDIYYKLTNYILFSTSFLKKEQIHIIHSHDTAVKFIPEDLNDGEKINIVNIDHHHDLGYDKEDVEENCKVNKCSNWVKWLRENKNVGCYQWIKDKQSSRVDAMDLRIKQYLNIATNIEDINGMETILPRPDVLVICLSEPWVPPAIRPLFFLWLDTLNKIYDTHFDFEDN